MNNIYHILNGDALKERFPNQIKGDLLVARECLVDGPVTGSDLPALFAGRATYLSATYGGSTSDYYEQVVPEFEQILQLEHGANVYLWFEDDLFCQVNLWFVLYLLHYSNQTRSIYLVRPGAESPYSFGHLDPSNLLQQFEQAQMLTNLDALAQLWPAYQQQDLEQLIKLGHQLGQSYPFITEAVQAQADRIPNSNSAGRPISAIKEIITDLQTQEFGPVFREFIRREGIYGFGDLQVKRLFDQVIQQS